MSITSSWKALSFSLLFFGLETSGALAATYTGHKALWQDGRPISVKVALPEFTKGQYLSNDLVSVKPIPTNLVPDSSGCFCFSVTDERFAYVQTYYEANINVAEYNTLLSQLGIG